jgi:hypothetical protein
VAKYGNIFETISTKKLLYDLHGKYGVLPGYSGPLPAVHLEPLHQQAKFHCERDPDLKWPQDVPSKALDETNV